MTKALIVGGGIAGAVTAMALRQAGIESIIYEAYPTGADDIGAFLTIMKNGMNALRAVRAHQPVIDAAFPATAVELLDGKGNRLGINPMSGEAFTIKRSTLYRVLHDEAARRELPIEHGKRLISADATGNGVIARFADGSRAEGDLLIGADGIGSATRSIIDPESPDPRFTGLTIAYGYTRATSFEQSAAAYRMISGKRAFFGYTTSPDGETWWFARVPGVDLDDATPTLLAALLAEDDTPAAEIVRATEDAIFNYAYDVPETPHWHSDSMVLVGDAAHAASPAAGQGASMALEDSVILAKCLRDIPDLRQAFSAYTAIRRPRVERLVTSSAEQGSNATPGPLKRLLRRRPAKPQPADRAWLYDHTIDWQEPVSQ